MGNLSEHFSYRDFACRCGECRNQVKVHLGLVGALEAIMEHFKKIPKITEAFRCDILSDKKDLQRKNAHRLGKAAHIYIEGVALAEVFKFAEALPEIRGIGYYPSEKVLHIDTRSLDKDEEKDLWIKEGTKITELTKELRPKYGL